MRKTIVTVLAALATVSAIATPAAAVEGPVSVEVFYADLNLDSAAGTAVLSQRIEAAVDTVCAKSAPRDLKSAAAWQKCRTVALAGAMEAISASAKLQPVQVALKL
jgi:UrcA family protein